MDFKTFLENFDAIAQAPNGIPKLRSLILDLAVRGKLVPQNPEDEPASELFRRIKNEFKELVTQRKIRKIELPKLEDSEINFDKPTGWECCRLGEIIRVSSGENLTSHKMTEGGRIPVFGGNGITGFHDQANVDKPTLVIGRVGFYCGSVHITPSKAWVTDNAFVTTFSENNIYIHFLFWLLKTINLQQNNSATAQPVISGGKIYSLPVPLPPLAEQKRIVEKVDELMALCDRLQSSQKSQDNLRQKLRESAIASLMNAETDEELKQSWAIVRDNWHTLSQKPEDVGDLRHIAIQLAVEGKLVAQKPTDEPASFIVKRALEKRASLITVKKIGKREAQPPIEEYEIPFELPANWECTRLGEITDIVSGVTKGRKLEGRKTSVYPYLRVANVQRWHLNLEVMKEIEILVEELDKYRLQIGDVLLTEGGDWDKLGRSAIWQGEIEDCIHQNHVFRARSLDSGLSPEWIVMFTNSLPGRKYFESAAKRTTNLASINMTQLRFCPLPIPPEEEQKRIVAKVDELMQMCDQLEESLRQSQQLAEALAASAINHLEI